MPARQKVRVFVFGLAPIGCETADFAAIGAQKRKNRPDWGRIKATGQALKERSNHRNTQRHDAGSKHTPIYRGAAHLVIPDTLGNCLHLFRSWSLFLADLPVSISRGLRSNAAQKRQGRENVVKERRGFTPLGLWYKNCSAPTRPASPRRPAFPGYTAKGRTDPSRLVGR